MSKFIPNSFQVPNVVVDAYAEILTGNAFKCLVIIIRKTRGWHKESDAISHSSFKGMSVNTAKKALSELVGAGLISATPSEKNNGLITYSLTDMFNSGLSEIDTQAKKGVSETDRGVSETDRQNAVCLSETDTTKDIIKDTNKKHCAVAVEKSWSPSLIDVNKRLAITTAKPITQDQLDGFIADVVAWYAGKNLSDGQMFVHLIKWIVRTPVESTPAALYNSPSETKRLCAQQQEVDTGLAKSKSDQLLRVLLGGAA